MLHISPMALSKFYFKSNIITVLEEMSLEVSKWPPSWKRNDIIDSESPCYFDGLSQILVQSDIWFRSRCHLKIFNMASTAAILDIGTERFRQLWIPITVATLTPTKLQFNPTYGSGGDAIWKISKWKIGLYLKIKTRDYSMLLPNLLYAELLSFFDCLATFPSLPVLSGFMELFTREDNFNCFPDTWYDDQLYTDDVKRIT